MQDVIKAISTQPDVARLATYWEVHYERVVEQALTIHAIPAPTFAEAERAAYVLDAFQEYGLEDVCADGLNNVYGRTPGLNGGGAGVMVSAHLDTVFPAETSLETRRSGGRIHGAGLGDNSLGLAAMLQLARQVSEWGVQPPQDIWWVATVGEEGLGDLRGMREAIKQLEGKLSSAIILEGIGLGKVYNAGLGVRRLKISVEGPGGHSWLHPNRPSAIHALLRIGAAIVEEVNLPKKPRSTLNVGLVEGGTSINTRASAASLAIDMRSTRPDTLSEIEKQVRTIIAGHSGLRSLKVRTMVVGDRPSAALSNQHPLVTGAQAVLKHVGYRPSNPEIGSTDANIPLAEGIPSVCVGITIGGDAHTTNEYILVEPVAAGMQQLTLLTFAAAHHAESWGEWF